ncbi:MAG: 2-succinyl-6-hydroxy-2,4-cyclohexadiene-1-carboxylate synthase [Deltaproteobacteria bacterium]|nr:2-succinyl-6-hydroxy-2,4-cyclohexadiene-1-carboxylate synthase [Deltaproteobacteria bacterium]
MSRRIAVRGVHYALREWGSGAPLLLLHGFTGAAALWEPLALAFAARHRVIAVDLLGHGASDAPRAAARYGMAHAVADLAALLDALRVERTALLGYSLGGRVALGLAVEQPQRVGALVLESSSPGLAAPVERAARRAADATLAARLARDGLPAFVDAWMAQPLFASQARLAPARRAAARAQRLDNRIEGLAGSLRGLGSGAQPSYWPRLAALPMPVLLLAGGLDAKFTGIARAMRARIPRAALRIVADAGHAVHLEQPQAYREAVSSFLAAAPTLTDSRGAAAGRSLETRA